MKVLSILISKTYTTSSPFCLMPLITSVNRPIKTHVYKRLTIMGVLRSCSWSDPGHGAGISDGGCCFDDDDCDEDTSNDFFGEILLSVCLSVTEVLTKFLFGTHVLGKRPS